MMSLYWMERFRWNLANIHRMSWHCWRSFLRSESKGQDYSTTKCNFSEKAYVLTEWCWGSLLLLLLWLLLPLFKIYWLKWQYQEVADTQRVTSELSQVCDHMNRAGLNIRGSRYQRKVGAFSRTRSQDFLICGGALFSPQKLTTFFLVVVTFKRTLNVQTSKRHGKNLAADRRGAPCDGSPLPWYNRHNG